MDLHPLVTAWTVMFHSVEASILTPTWQEASMVQPAWQEAFLVLQA